MVAASARRRYVDEMEDGVAEGVGDVEVEYRRYWHDIEKLRS
jgi:hypothetical protein